MHLTLLRNSNGESAVGIAVATRVVAEVVVVVDDLIVVGLGGQCIFFLGQIGSWFGRVRSSFCLHFVTKPKKSIIFMSDGKYNSFLS